MPLLSSCPKCDKPVLIPDGVDASAKAQCPLCDEQFQLQELFSSLPPMLEILDRPIRPVHAAAVAADEDEEGFVEFGSGVFAGHGAADRADAKDASSLGDSNVLSLERTDETAKEAASPGGSFGGVDFGAIGEGDEAGTDVESEGMFQPASTAAPASLATKPRPRRKGPGPLIQFGGIAGFGVLGLLIGYSILLMIKGSQGDFMGIGKYFPSFIYSPDKNGASDDNPNVAVNKPASRAKPKADNVKKGFSFKNGDGEKQLPELKFDIENPEKANGKSDPEPAPIGPTALKETLRVDIELALDDVAVKAAALAAMQAAAQDDSANGTDGKISDLGRATRDHYFALGHLGLTLASAKQGSLHENDELVGRITQFVHNAASNVDTFEGIGDKASKWLDYEKVEDDEGNVKQKGREGRDGILIAGGIESIALSPDAPPRYTAKVKLAGTGKLVTVVGAGSPPAESGRVLLLGAIISDPTKNLAGYQGDEGKVVWTSLSINPPQDDQRGVEPPLEDQTEEPAPNDPVKDEQPKEELGEEKSPEKDSPQDEPTKDDLPKSETPEIDVPE